MTQKVLRAKFTSYRSAIFRIIEKIDNNHLFSKVGEFSNNLDKEEFLGMFQHMTSIHTKNLEYLNKNHSNITKTVIEKYISIYDNLSGNLEKFVRYLVWISRVFEGETPDYDKIRNDGLANLYDSILDRVRVIEMTELKDSSTITGRKYIIIWKQKLQRI